MSPSSEPGGLRALVLAAGRGERLRPLTEQSPKPLLPVLGASILERTLRRLAAAGVESTAVNLFHLGEQIPASLGPTVAGMPIDYRPEATLLGTLGPLGRLGEFFAGCDPVLMANGDSLCDWPVAALVEAHRGGGAAATLLLSSRADADAFGGGVVVDENGEVLSFHGEGQRPGTRRGVFAGFHAIDPGLLRQVDPVPSDIVRDLYKPALERGLSIRGVFTSRAWHDLGTPRRYLEGVLDECRRRANRSSGGWRHPSARVADDAEVVDSVIEASCDVGPGSSLERSLLLPGAAIGAGVRVTGSILGPGVELAAGSEAINQLVTAGESPVSTAL